MHEAPTEIDLQLCYPSPKARAVDMKAVKVLAGSIEQVGLMTPITVRRVQKSRAGQLCDAFEVIFGMHRVKAYRQLERAKIPAVVLDVDDLHAELMLIDENLIRNELSPAERASAIARRKAIHTELFGSPKAKGAHAAHAAMGHAHDANANLADAFTTETAEATGQSERTVQRDAKRGEGLGEAALAKVAHTSLDKGEELDALAKLSPEARDDLIDRAAKGEKVSAKTAVKKEQRSNREATLGGLISALPTKQYGVIVCDDEWDHEVWSRESGMDRHAANHYETADDAHTAAELHERTKARFECAAPHCFLAMWVTVQHLAIGVDLLRLRGFRYVSHYIWGKDKIGLGFWNRNKHEVLLLGVKGNIPCPAPGTQWESLIMAPRGEHSAKPECFLEMIEQYFPTLPKIELNRRGPARPGWDAWGNEAVTPDSNGVVEDERAA